VLRLEFRTSVETARENAVRVATVDCNCTHKMLNDQVGKGYQKIQSIKEARNIFTKVKTIFSEEKMLVGAASGELQTALAGNRGVTRGGKGAHFPGRRIHCGGRQKSPSIVTNTFVNTVHLLPEDLRFEHGAANLLLTPGAV